MSNTGWNRPASNVPTQTKKHGNGVAVKYVISVLALAAVAGIIVWLCQSGPEAESNSHAASRGKIKEVTPAKARTTAATNTANATSAKPKKEWDVSKMSPTMRRAYLRSQNKVKAAFHVGSNEPGAPKRLFDHPSEVILENLVTVPLGGRIYGLQTPPNLEEDFLKSLETPIIIDKDDTPEDAERKRNMRQLKIEIKARLDNGEKLADIVNEECKRINQIATLREEGLILVSEAAATEGTREDVQALIDAVNVKLKEKGAEPLRMSKLMEVRIRRREKAAQNK